MRYICRKDNYKVESDKGVPGEIFDHVQDRHSDEVKGSRTIPQVALLREWIKNNIREEA